MRGVVLPAGWLLAVLLMAACAGGHLAGRLPGDGAERPEAAPTSVPSPTAALPAVGGGADPPPVLLKEFQALPSLPETLDVEVASTGENHLMASILARGDKEEAVALYRQGAAAAGWTLIDEGYYFAWLTGFDEVRTLTFQKGPWVLHIGIGEPGKLHLQGKGFLAIGIDIREARHAEEARPAQVLEWACGAAMEELAPPRPPEPELAEVARSLPIYPGVGPERVCPGRATDGGMVTAYKVDAPRHQVAEFYRKALPEAGWEPQGEISGPGWPWTSLGFRRGALQLWVDVMPEDPTAVPGDRGPTVVLVQLGRGPAAP